VCLLFSYKVLLCWGIKNFPRFHGYVGSFCAIALFSWAYDLDCSSYNINVWQCESIALISCSSSCVSYAHLQGSNLAWSHTNYCVAAVCGHAWSHMYHIHFLLTHICVHQNHTTKVQLLISLYIFPHLYTVHTCCFV